MPISIRIIHGTQLLLDCITYANENPFYDLDYSNIKRIIKPIAKKHQTSIKSIIWNMHTSVYDMCKITDEELKKNIYGSDIGINYQKIIKTFVDLY